MIKIATKSDFIQIIEIQKQNLFDFSQFKNVDYLNNISKTGFFIAPYSLEELQKDKDKILLVNKKDNKILAYLWISIITDDHKYNWFDSKLKSELFSKKVYKIKGIGVLKDNRSKGLASELLNYSYKYLKNKSIKYLISSIAFYPIVNTASINFHKKQNFTKVALSPKVPYFGFKKYQCLIYSKKLSR